MTKVDPGPSRVNPGLTKRACEILKYGGYEAQAAQKKSDFGVGVHKYYDIYWTSISNAWYSRFVYAL